MTGVSAKTLLLKIAHGGSVPKVECGDTQDWLHRLSRGARFLRWLAVDQLRELHDGMCRDRFWPENTAFAYWWQSMEDRVLSHLEAIVLSVLPERPRHLSLH